MPIGLGAFFGLLSRIPGLSRVFQLLGRALGPMGAIFGSSRLGGTFGSVVTAVAHMFSSMVTAASRVVSKAVGKIPVEGSLMLLLYIMACNADLIVCNKPAEIIRRQMADMMYASLMSVAEDSLYNPSPPPPPPEYLRPRIVPATAGGPRLMSYVPLAGFSIVHACPWMMREVAARPAVVLSYSPSETVVLTRASTHSGV